MNELQELYQELIIDHGRHPRNFKYMDDASVSKEGFNPLCGDRLTLFLKIENDKIIDVTFKGQGCAISMASASLMTDALKNKSVQEAKKIFQEFHEMVTGSCDKSATAFRSAHESGCEKLSALKGVCEYPSRVKCATLAWHTLMAAIEHQPGNVSTE